MILHAEHKAVLEEMRTHYSLMHTEEKKENSASLGRSKTFLSDLELFSKDVNTKGVNGKSTKNSAKLENFYNDFDVRSLFGSSSASSRTNIEKASRFVSINPGKLYEENSFKISCRDAKRIVEYDFVFFC